MPGMSVGPTFARTGDIVTHYAVDGEPGGTAIVYANSLGTDLRIWDAVVAELGPGLRSLRYDKRGHGLTDCTPGPYTIEQLATDLDRLMDVAGFDDAIVCGVSVGGEIAQALAALGTKRIRALVLCDTAAKIGTEAMWADRIAALETGGIASIADAILERWFAPVFRETDPDGLAGWGNMLLRTPLEGYIGVCGALRDADLTAAAGRIDVPTLVVCGAQDGATPPDMVEAFAGLIPGAEFALIDGAGHLPSIEQPQALAARIAAFLKEHDLA
jgi:3-oxoadipate enol-lactonase